jgi:hypothetical protein
MRCVGSEKPPCTRCAKGGRQCIVPRSKRYGESHSGLAWQEQGQGSESVGPPQSSSSTIADAGHPVQLHQRGSYKGTSPRTLNTLQNRSIELDSPPETSTTAAGIMRLGQMTSQAGGAHQDLSSIYSTSPISAFDQQKEFPGIPGDFTTNVDIETRNPPKRRRLYSNTLARNSAQSINPFDANGDEEESLNDQHLLQLVHL